MYSGLPLKPLYEVVGYLSNGHLSKWGVESTKVAIEMFIILKYFNQNSWCTVTSMQCFKRKKKVDQKLGYKFKYISVSFSGSGGRYHKKAPQTLHGQKGHRFGSTGKEKNS